LGLRWPLIQRAVGKDFDGAFHEYDLQDAHVEMFSTEEEVHDALAP
jgi:hypothetical protein